MNCSFEYRLPIDSRSMYAYYLKLLTTTLLYLFSADILSLSNLKYIIKFNLFENGKNRYGVQIHILYLSDGSLLQN